MNKKIRYGDIVKVNCLEGYIWEVPPQNEYITQQCTFDGELLIREMTRCIGKANYVIILNQSA